MLHKTCPALIKAAGADDGLGDGQFEALVSVFGVKDSYGDVVVPTAFDDTLADWAAKGDPIPIYWSHRMDDPDYNIGYALDAKATSEGLVVRGQLDLDEDELKARKVYKLFKGRRVTQFSFAYDVLEGGWVETEDDEFYELRKLRLYEVGPTPIGANQDTDLLAVKAASEHARHFTAAVKAGRVLSAKNETTLREARDQLAGAAAQIDDVLSALDDGEETDDSKAKTGEPGNDETHPGKSEDPMRRVSVERSALLALEYDAAASL